VRFAFFSPPFQGHLQPAASLAEALTRRGHECFLVAHPDTQVPDRGFRPLFIDPALCQWTPQKFSTHARSSGLPFGIGRLVRDMTAITDSLCLGAPSLLREHGIDGVVSDQMEPAGALVAAHLGLPYVTLAAAAPINREPLMPLPVLPWRYEEGEQALGRNRAGEAIADWLTKQHDRAISQWSERFGIASRHKLTDCLSPLADMSQMTAGLDFPRQHLPASFHHLGRLRPLDTEQDRTDLPRFGSGPLVYASLGTLQGHRLGLFRRIAKACRSLGVQLVVAHSGALSAAEARLIDADWVLPWVPQEALLAHTDVAITHGGLNTVLDSLAEGVPLLCLPLAFEQPGIGARIERSGAGITLSPRSSIANIAAALGRLLEQQSFKARAGALAQELANSPGSAGAAMIVERAIATRQPVLRDAGLEAAHVQ
jgi:zeaxanthin glucosyltransferase